MTTPNPTIIAAFQIRLSEAAETLPVLFGRDGDFEGAPDWRCNLFHDGGYVPFFSFRVDGEFTFFSAGSSSICSRRRSVELLEGYALDLRVPSVAARVAGLCARALGHGGDGWAVYVTDAGTACLQRFDETICFAAPGVTVHPGPISFPREAFESVDGFFRALFLALAPRIAALGGNNVR